MLESLLLPLHAPEFQDLITQETEVKNWLLEEQISGKPDSGLEEPSIEVGTQTQL